MSFKVNKTNSSNVGIFNENISIPSTLDITTFPVQQRGSLVYNIDDSTVYISTGLEWITTSGGISFTSSTHINCFSSNKWK